MKRAISAWFCLVLIGGIFNADAQTTTSSMSYAIADRGGMTFSTLGGSARPVNVGYGMVQPNSGNGTPAGVAIFGYRANGVLVTEAGVPAMVPILSGRTYAEVNGPINTGIAIANPNASPVTISFHFTDQNGNDFGQGSFTMNAGAQMASFLNQNPFSASVSFAGSFSFSASAPVGIIALRGFTNERGDFTITTQTVASTSAVSSSPLVMAHFADGGGWTTQVLLVNSTDQAISGTVQFYGEGSGNVAATPVTLTVNGQVGVTFSYAIPARSSVKLQSAGVGALIQAGSVLVTPTPGANAPSGFTVFSYMHNGVTVTQASVTGQPTGSSFRMYVESSGTSGSSGSIQSGIAVTNASSTAATVNCELLNLDGTSTGLTASLTIAASGHTAKFLDEIFPGISTSFRGIVRITSNSGVGSIAVVALRTRYNERGDFLITTTTVSDESSASTTATLVFPHIVDMGGYTTQFVLFSAIPGQTAMGTVSFFNQSVAAMTLTLQ